MEGFSAGEGKTRFVLGKTPLATIQVEDGRLEAEAGLVEKYDLRSGLEFKHTGRSWGEAQAGG